MWRLVAVTVVLWNSITSQPIIEDTENDTPRYARQLDFVHCCPCPSPDAPGLSSTGFNAVDGGSNVGANSVARAALVDDCPCRSRGADTQGASSVFFPRTVPFRPTVNQPESPKEDQKPLLHPEVDLASSMLETLREVTDEEYQDALARDAARNAARVNQLGDDEPETAKNLVTIIVNARDVTEDDTEVTPEASNVQETKCVHPLGSPHLGQVRDVPNILKLQPLYRNPFEMDGSASEVKENVVSLNKGLESLRLRTAPSVLKLIPSRKTNEGNIQSMLKLNNDNLPNADENNSNRFKSTLGSKIPNLRLTPPPLKNDKSIALKPLKLDLKSLQFPKLRKNVDRKPKTSEAENIDSSKSPSNLQEYLSKHRLVGNAPAFDLKTLIPNTDLSHFSLKNLLNMKNVEFIPTESNTPKIQIQGLNLLPHLKDNKSSADSNKPSKSCKDKEIGKNVGLERSQKFQTEILDTIPHASENNPVFVSSDQDIETTTVGLNGASTASQDTNIKTQILDVLPSASENTHIVANSKHKMSLPIVPTPPSTEILETTDADRELEQHAAEEPIIESDQTLSKHKIKNINLNDSSLELIINGGEDTEINAVEFIDETDEPFNNLDIGGITFDNNGQSFDLNFIKDTSNINHEDSDSVNVENDITALEFGLDDDREMEMEDEASEGEILFRENISTDKSNYDDALESSTENDKLFSDDDISAETTTAPMHYPNTELLSFGKDKITLKLKTLRNPDKSEILTISRLSIPEKKENLEKEKESEDLVAAKEMAESSTENGKLFTDDDITQSKNAFPDSDFISAETTNAPIHNPNTDLLSSVKEKITLKLKTLRNPDKSKILTISRLSIPEKKENLEKEEESEDLVAAKEVADSGVLAEEAKHFSIDEKAVEMETGASNQVTTQDLSNMSDSLLATSQSQSQESRDSGGDCKLSVDNSNSLNVRDGDNLENRSMEGNLQEQDLFSDTDSAATTFIEQNANLNFLGDENNLTKNNEKESNNLKETEEEDSLKVTDKTTDSCSSNFKANQDSSETTVTDAKNYENEMAPQASETTFNTAAKPVGLASRLRQSTVVQPNTLFNPINLVPPLTPLTLGDLNLPTLEDITSGLQGLLGGNARSSNGDKIMSSDTSDEDCSEAGAGMATGASSNKAKSSIAPLKHLEDINLDIFQINPLSQKGLAAKMPSVNLNSFKTKFSLPPSLDLKPLKLESTLGHKNGGLLGASLTFGPEKVGSSRKAVSKLGSILNKQGSDILGNPLGSMPSLEELRSKMRENAQSLLKSPLIKQTLNPLEDTLKSSQVLGESLRSHHENTLRNLQQSLGTSLTQTRLSGASNAGNKFTKPQDLFEKVSLAHEDMNDKLHAIHIDLQDRLSSIHDRIIDQSNLPMLRSPLLGLEKVEEEPKGTWKIGNQRSSAQVQSQRMTAQPKKVIGKNPKAKVNKPKTKDIKEVKPFRMSKAASSLAPKSVEVPKLVTPSSAPPFFMPLQNDDSLKLKQPGSNLVNERPKALLTKQYKPFGDFKITIATTPKPTTSKTTLKPESIKPSIPKEDESRHKMLSKKVTPNTLTDSRGFASESMPSQVSAPVRPVPSKSNTEEATVRSHLPSPKLFLESRAFPSKPLASPERISLKASSPKLSLPKPTENPLVANLRDAIRIRLSRPTHSHKPQKMEPLAKPMRSNDMTNAPSENNAVILKPEPMKENVSYRCKMVCVRD